MGRVAGGIVIRKYNELELNNTAKELLILLKFLTNNTGNGGGGGGKLFAIRLKMSPPCDNCYRCVRKLYMLAKDGLPTKNWSFIRAYDTEV